MSCPVGPAALPVSETELFPPAVAHFSVAYDPDAGLESSPFAIALPAAIRNAVPRRRLEFAAGRHCVREALRQLDEGLQHAEVGIGPQRQPLFPAGVVGAISHGAGIALAAVAWQRDVCGLGVDIEGWIGSDMLASVEDSALVPGESTRLQQQTRWSAVRVATVIFSAKETLYKCLFPTVQRYFDFKDAEIDAIDPAAGIFTARLRISLTDTLRENDRFVGRIQFTDALVLTTMVRCCAP